MICEVVVDSRGLGFWNLGQGFGVFSRISSVTVRPQPVAKAVCNWFSGLPCRLEAGRQD
jgi:hypothetical protein